MTGPTVAEERAHALRERLGKSATPDARAALATPWRTHGLVASLVFFGLTCVGVATLFGFLGVLELPKASAGFIAIVLGEWLIRRGRWFRTGVESALWLGGLFALIFSLPGEGKPEALLLFAAACALAGWRMRDALFGAGAAHFVIAYIVAKEHQLLAMMVAVTIALVALAALARTWQRPSTEWLWIVLLVTMPVAAFLSDDAIPERHLVVFVPLSVLFLAAGLRMRHHAPLVAAMLAAAIGAHALHELFEPPAELTFACAGVLLLTSSFAVARKLRDRDRGIVVTPSSITAHDDLLEAAATSLAAPQPADAPEEGRPQGEGRFGGAGATGDY